MSPSDMKILVIGQNVWGRGDTLEEALQKAGKPKHYVVYIAHPDTRVDEFGCFCYPSGDEDIHQFAPKEVWKK